MDFFQLVGLVPLNFVDSSNPLPPDVKNQVVPSTVITAPTFRISPKAPQIDFSRKPSRSSSPVYEPSPITPGTIDVARHIYPDIQHTDAERVLESVSASIVNDHIKRRPGIVPIRSKHRDAQNAPEVDHVSDLEVATRQSSMHRRPSDAPEVERISDLEVDVEALLSDSSRPLSFVPSPVRDRGRPALQTPNNRTFLPPSRSPSTSNTIHTSRPFDVGFSKLKLEGGFYFRLGRLVIPDSFYLRVSKFETDVIRVFQDGQFLCSVELGVTLNERNFPFTVTGNCWYLGPGEYDTPELLWMKVTVPKGSRYTVQTYVPAELP